MRVLDPLPHLLDTNSVMLFGLSHCQHVRISVFGLHWLQMKRCTWVPQNSVAANQDLHCTHRCGVPCSLYFCTHALQTRSTWFFCSLSWKSSFSRTDWQGPWHWKCGVSCFSSPAQSMSSPRNFLSSNVGPSRGPWVNTSRSKFLKISKCVM